jgi:hypothetical protein
MSSFANDIERRITDYPDGQVFVPSDFLDITSLVNINNVLARLLKKGSIRRWMRGIYSKPMYSTFLDKEVSPKTEDVISAIARKNKWQLAPTGATALNRIGLSTQIPARVEFASTGPNRTYSYGNLEIRLLHRSSRDIADKSPITLTFIQALKELGKGKIDSIVKSKLSSKLTTDQIDTVYNETRDVTSWIFEVAKELKDMAA